MSDLVSNTVYQVLNLKKKTKKNELNEITLPRWQCSVSKQDYYSIEAHSE